jgi:hypothetical protein
VVGSSAACDFHSIHVRPMAAMHGPNRCAEIQRHQQVQRHSHTAPASHPQKVCMATKWALRQKAGECRLCSPVVSAVAAAISIVDQEITWLSLCDKLVHQLSDLGNCTPTGEPARKFCIRVCLKNTNAATNDEHKFKRNNDD